MTDDKNDRNDRIYRKLKFFKSNNQEIHINIIGGRDKGLWRNGYTLDISLKQKCLVFVDDILGELPYLFEELDENIVAKKEGRR